jgi:hypothetical protein
MAGLRACIGEERFIALVDWVRKQLQPRLMGERAAFGVRASKPVQSKSGNDLLASHLPVPSAKA